MKKLIFLFLISSFVFVALSKPVFVQPAAELSELDWAADLPTNVCTDNYKAGDFSVLNGNVGIGTASPSTNLNVIGDIYITGKITSDGGNDPPYVQYLGQTRGELVARVEREIPADKWEDAPVLFWNKETKGLELYNLKTGQFSSLRDVKNGLYAASMENYIADYEIRLDELRRAKLDIKDESSFMDKAKNKFDEIPWWGWVLLGTSGLGLLN